MKTICQWEYTEIDGKKIESGKVYTEYEDPIFLNMQFCMERDQFEALRKNCKEYKTSIIKAIQDILEYDPEKLIEQYF